MHKLGAVVLASGISERFGERNKLLVSIDGQTLIERAMDVLPADVFEKRVVVTRSAEVAELAKQHGFETVVHTLTEVSDTIRLGIEQMEGMDGCLFLVGDQPFLTADTVSRIAQAFSREPSRIVRASCGSKEGNPVLFPAALFHELATLESGRSGGSLIKRRRSLVLPVEVEDERELMDIDTPEDYARLSNDSPDGANA